MNWSKWLALGELSALEPLTNGFVLGKLSALVCLQLLMILLKTADISNEVRPLEVAEPWIECLLEEFFIQVVMETLLISPPIQGLLWCQDN